MGISRIYIIDGARFSRWTVLQLAPEDKWGHTMYECRCDCGYVGIVSAAILRRNRSKQCRRCAEKRRWENRFSHAGSPPESKAVAYVNEERFR